MSHKENNYMEKDVSPGDSEVSAASSVTSKAESGPVKNVQFTDDSPSVFYRHDDNLESALYSTDEEAGGEPDSNRESPEIKRLRNSLKHFTIGSSGLSTQGAEEFAEENHSRDELSDQFDAEAGEFNKRPLSDTPIVSGVNSPSAMSPLVLSDEEEDLMEEEEEKNNDMNPSSAELRQHQLKKVTDANTRKNKQIPPPDSLHEWGSAFSFPGQAKPKQSASGAGVTINEKLVVVMVGLPARGKSYLSKKLVRYLNWLQIPSKIFNVGSTRRAKSKLLGPSNAPLPDGQQAIHDASFFSPNNTESVKLREEWARETLEHLLDYLLNHDGCVGVFDATNTTVKRRQMVFETIRKDSHGKLKVLYLESICNDKRIIDDNVRLKLDGPDYKQMDRAKALQDFRGRLSNYANVYETISPKEEQNKYFQYIQMIDVGRKVIACNIKGFIPSQIIYYFLNFNLSKRLTFIARHGESTDNLRGRIGGDAPLTERGRLFAKALVRFIDFKKKQFRETQLHEYNEKLDDKYYKDFVEAGELHTPEEPQFQVLSSTMKRSVQTIKYFPEDRYAIKQLRALDELGSGSFDGMTYKEIQDQYPEEFAARLADKMSYRYPGVGGESYLDVINRLKPIINEMERTTNHMLIITHRVVSRILLAYFLNLKREAVGELDVPLHAVYVFESRPFGVEWKLYEYNESKDWFYEVDPNNMENSKKVRQVGITYRERKYSVVPTAPKRALSSISSAGSQGSVGSIRSSLKEFARANGLQPSISLRNPLGRAPGSIVVGDLKRARGIPLQTSSSSTSSLTPANNNTSTPTTEATHRSPFS
ncbi:hypothetical protein FOA43_003897 [Brettanomyces nanus]|uniref:6-phosphofructo-2-kinase domain-containing protein n=1 Tax=Eeniella nana TaxID=13502 RepID=A0A875S6D8_EENNA|nr:uncharacterized protein FOA43_003897 [Brettanomyces nanus]QPG76508.1 hypothetical protein FOA43_003897 [Brettanomyces nanus]